MESLVPLEYGSHNRDTSRADIRQHVWHKSCPTQQTRSQPMVIQPTALGAIVNRDKMPLYVSDSLPAFRLTFAGKEFNEYRFRQGRVEFRSNRGAWRVLEDEDIQFHLVLHTEVAKWLIEHSANTSGTEQSKAAKSASRILARILPPKAR